MKPRHHLYLDHDLTERLDTLAAKPGSSKSAIVADALKFYLDRRASRELDDLLKVRLDRIERNLEILLESLALYVHYHLIYLPQLGEKEMAPARALAKDRFLAFTDQVGRQVATGRTFSRDVANRSAKNVNGGTA